MVYRLLMVRGERWLRRLAVAPPARIATPVTLGLLLAATLAAQDRLEDVVPLLPKAEPWMAECEGGFSFRHAPLREDAAWFVARLREDRHSDKPGHYLVAWTARGGGEVRSVDLGQDLCHENQFVGPVWSLDSTRIAVAITSKVDVRTSKRVVVVDTKTATATTWLEDVFHGSLSWTADGSLLVITDGARVRALKGPDEEVWRIDLPCEPGSGAAAAISPDGKQVLAVCERGVFLLAPDRDQPDRLGDVQVDATIFTAPQWSPDGTKAVAVAGGAVTMIDVGKKVVRCVGEATLGGRAHAVVWAPGAMHALAFVEQVHDGSLPELLLGAGHARQPYTALPVLVAGTGDRVLPLPKLRTKTPDPGATPWIYRPQLSEALSRWSR